MELSGAGEVPVVVLYFVIMTIFALHEVLSIATFWVMCDYRHPVWFCNWVY
jgi:hypothetical protein